MKTIFAVFISLILLPFSHIFAQAQSSGDNAGTLCQMIDASGLTSSPCSYSAFDKTIIVTLNMSASEARKLCPQLAMLARDKGLNFSSGWILKIKSPYSNSSIAFCNL